MRLGSSVAGRSGWKVQWHGLKQRRLPNAICTHYQIKTGVEWKSGRFLKALEVRYLQRLQPHVITREYLLASRILLDTGSAQAPKLNRSLNERKSSVLLIGRIANHHNLCHPESAGAFCRNHPSAVPPSPLGLSSNPAL